MRGTGFLPTTGGLLLGDEAASALASTGSFAISQDQRHTVRSRVSYQLNDRSWLAVGVSYGRGLPVEFDGDPAQALAQYGARIVGRVDFEAGRRTPVGVGRRGVQHDGPQDRSTAPARPGHRGQPDQSPECHQVRRRS
jgi:hypothetical protein